MSRMQERFVVGAVLVGGPLLFYLTVGRGQAARIDRLREERLKVEAEFSGPMPFVPVSQDERRRLVDPEATWRDGIVAVQGDQGRLAHYHGVISEYQRACRERGAAVAGFRSSWDPIRSSFSLPDHLSGASLLRGLDLDQPETRLAGWVFEARFLGGTDRVFKGLDAAYRIQPLLEPVALRWEAAPGGAITHLALRNLYRMP